MLQTEVGRLCIGIVIIITLSLVILVAWVLPLFLELNRCWVYTQYLTSSV